MHRWKLPPGGRSRIAPIFALEIAQNRTETLPLSSIKSITYVFSRAALGSTPTRFRDVLVNGIAVSIGPASVRREGLGICDNLDVVEGGVVAAVWKAFDADFILWGERYCEGAVAGGSIAADLC